MTNSCLLLTFFNLLFQLFDAHRIFQPELADAGAAQAAQVTATAQLCTVIVGKAADIGSRGANNFEMYIRHFHFGDAELGNGDRPGLQFDVFSPPGQFVYPLAFFFDGGMNGRHLQDGAGERYGGFLQVFGCKVAGGLEILRAAFQVKGWRNGSQGDSAGVFFFLRHVFVDLLGEFSGADNQKARCQRIQRAGMPDLFGAGEITDFANGIERGPAERLVDQ